MDDEERHYQDWFDKLYPEVSRITREGDYVNEPWLRSPALDSVPVDDMFHFSHCVLVSEMIVLLLLGMELIAMCSLGVEEIYQSQGNWKTCLRERYRRRAHASLSRFVGLVGIS